MLESGPDSVSRFVHFYKGVENFYFLNKEGDLGYIKSGTLRPLKETFPQLKSRSFLNSNPEFMRELDLFLRELVEIASIYLEKAPLEMELGYMLPSSEQNQWRSATLVLHKHVLQTIKSDHQMLAQKGEKELVEEEMELARIMAVRGIHQGLDELTYHKDAFGHYRYFPALFILPSGPGVARPQGSSSNVRVLNLRWRNPAHGAASGEKGQTRELVFTALRENLTQRGAIDRGQRIENRLSLA